MKAFLCWDKARITNSWLPLPTPAPFDFPASGAFIQRYPDYPRVTGVAVNRLDKTVYLANYENPTGSLSTFYLNKLSPNGAISRVSFRRGIVEGMAVQQDGKILLTQANRTRDLP